LRELYAVRFDRGGAFIPFVATAQRVGDMTFGVMAGANLATLEQDPDPNEVDYGYKPDFLRESFWRFR
jgi:hypothetical protein